MKEIKSHTDIPQSKVLAEILPIESADMYYPVVGDAVIGDYQTGISNARLIAKAWRKNPDEFAKKVIPCWSLSALLELLPAATLDTSDDHHYRIYCCYHFTEWYSTAIDAAVAMIKRLKELNEL